MKRCYLLLSALLLLLVGANSLSAQKTNRRGMWGELGVAFGGTLSDKSKDNMPKENSLGTNLSITPLGVHIPQLGGLQVGLGVYRANYGNPDGFVHDGVHLDLRYAPFPTLKRLQFSTMIGLFNFDKESGIFYGASYNTKAYGTLAVGWELPRLWGAFGLSPSIGVSYGSYDYVRFVDGGPDLVGSSSQATIFFRLGFRLN